MLIDDLKSPFSKLDPKSSDRLEFKNTLEDDLMDQSWGCMGQERDLLPVLCEMENGEVC